MRVCANCATVRGVKVPLAVHETSDRTITYCDECGKTEEEMKRVTLEKRKAKRI